MIADFTLFERYVSALRDLLATQKFAAYTCLVELNEELTSRMHSGRRHTAVPALDGYEAHTTLQATRADGGAFFFEFSGLGRAELAEALRDAMLLAVPRKHRPARSRHRTYPKLELASQDLEAILNDPQGQTRVDELARTLESYANLVEHPRLLGREVGACVGRSRRIYFDDSRNEAREVSTTLTAWTNFSLSDSSETHSDSFGELPEYSALQAIVAEASRNLTRHDVRELKEETGTPVVLTPRAVTTLFEELVLPNLSARTLLDGTGAWDISKLGKAVLPGVTLRDDPTLAHSPFSHTFDIEGTPARSVTVLEEGTLRHPLLTSTLLAEISDRISDTGLDVTGHATSATDADHTNLFISLGEAAHDTLEAFIASFDRCIVISHLTGMSVDPLTGQFALDAEGARVHKNGSLQYSTSLTLRGNLFEALADPKRIAGPVGRVYNVRAPAMATRKLACVPRRMAEE